MALCEGRVTGTKSQTEYERHSQHKLSNTHYTLQTGTDGSYLKQSDHPYGAQANTNQLKIWRVDVERDNQISILKSCRAK